MINENYSPHIANLTRGELVREGLQSPDYLTRRLAAVLEQYNQLDNLAGQPIRDDLKIV